MGAWIEIRKWYSLQLYSSVAPHMGAWIEIAMIVTNQSNALSHPIWVRGLKFTHHSTTASRGNVAPHMGAWIEIQALYHLLQKAPVAPHMGAWIEIIGEQLNYSMSLVAPHMGAWIEISSIGVKSFPQCRTPYGCVD